MHIPHYYAHSNCILWGDFAILRAFSSNSSHVFTLVEYRKMKIVENK